MADKVRANGVELELHPSGPRAWDPDDANEWARGVSAGSPGATFNVINYGADPTGESDDTAAFEAAIDAAKAWRIEHELATRVYIPAGNYNVKRPLYLWSKMTFEGDGQEATVISMPAGSKGYNIIVGDDKTEGAYFPVYASSLLSGPGSALVQQSGGGYAFDLTQSDEVRLVKGANRTLSFAFKATDASQLDDYSTVAFWGGRLNQSQVQPTLFQLRSDPSALNLIFRFNGQGYFKQIVTASLTGAISADVVYNVEVCWSAAGTIRVFINGELWSLGDYAPTGGSGDADASGFVSYPWEALTFGAGGSSYVLGEDAANGSVPYLDSIVDAIHFSSTVRHTASFANPISKPSPDASTIVLINWDEFYKGCVVAKGYAGTNRIYFYPSTTNVLNEHARVTLRNFRMIGGMGLRAEFASLMNVENISHLYPCDGWRFAFNGYYSNFRNIHLEAGVGRAAWFMGPWSYCSLVGVSAAGPIAFYFNGSNVYTSNLNSVVQANCYLGMFFGFGTGNFTGFNIDAEHASTVKFERPLMVVEPLSVQFSSSTIYGPPGSDKAPVELVSNHASEKGYPVDFDRCFFSAVPEDQPIVLATGDVEWAPAATIRSPLYFNTTRPALSSPATAAVDPDSSFTHAMSAPPTTGTWFQGDEIRNSDPQPGAYRYWVCVTGGTDEAAIWKGFGLIED